uniref:G protein-coupled receptor n=1 Tax=Romanomermis culicivorax TaxID=13658 RepID=A0A915HQF7_ROMCU
MYVRLYPIFVYVISVERLLAVAVPFKFNKFTVRQGVMVSCCLGFLEVIETCLAYFGLDLSKEISCLIRDSAMTVSYALTTLILKVLLVSASLICYLISTQILKHRITLYVPLTDSIEMMLEPAVIIVQQKWARKYVESLIKRNTQTDNGQKSSDGIPIDSWKYDRNVFKVKNQVASSLMHLTPQNVELRLSIQSILIGVILIFNNVTFQILGNYPINVAANVLFITLLLLLFLASPVVFPIQVGPNPFPEIFGESLNHGPKIRLIYPDVGSPLR